MNDIANDISSTIGKRIHVERAIRNWSLIELADRSGVSKAMLSTIERGKTSQVLDHPQSEAASALVTAAPDLHRAIARRMQEQG